MATIVSSSRIPWSDPGSGNTPAFREFVGVLTEMFSASGWINTNAVGSINPSTVDSPNYNTIAGYQVWRFNDTLHNSGYPVYVKTEYAAGTQPYWWGGVANTILYITVGFQHDGSGSIATGNVVGVGSTPRIGVLNAGGENSVYYSHRMCGISGGDLVGIVADTYSDVACTFHVERTKDINGNATTEGVVVSGIDKYYNAYRQSYLLYGPDSGSQTPPLETAPTYILAARSGVYDNNLTIGFHIPLLSSSFGYPSRMLGYINGNTLANGVTHLIPLYNTSSLYYVSSNTYANNTSVRGRNGSETGTFRYIIRYE